MKEIKNKGMNTYVMLFFVKLPGKGKAVNILWKCYFAGKVSRDRQELLVHKIST